MPRRAKDAAAQLSGLPTLSTWRSRTKAAMRRAIANGVRGTAMPAFRGERRRPADRHADRRDRPRNPIALEPPRNSRRSAIHRPTPRRYAADIQRGENRLPDLLRVLPRPRRTRRPERQRHRRTIHFSRSSAIRDCARSSSRAGPSWERPTGAATFPGQPMSDQEVTDVVAWLASTRVQTPGQPYSASNYVQHQEQTCNELMANETNLSRRALMQLGILFNAFVAAGARAADRAVSVCLRSRAAARTATSPGCRSAPSADFPRAKRGSPRFAIPT